MGHRCRTVRFTLLLWTVGMVFFGAGGAAFAQSMTPGGRFELAETVELDRVDHAVLAQWDRAKSLLADRQWDEAVEILCQLAETSGDALLGVTEHRYVDLRQWCQMRLAGLPPEALKLYRARVDAVAQQWYEQGISERNPRSLRNVVEQLFASNYGDQALMALGEMALEAGDYAAARWYWERIVPHRLPEGVADTWAGYPDTGLDVAAVRARLVLASILEGEADRARQELAELVRLHPEARGRLGGQDVNYAKRLSGLLAESAAWPAVPIDPNWRTFAGNARRNRVATPLVDVGAEAWRVPIRADASPGGPLSFYPLVVDDTVLLSDSQRILALRRDNGQPAWGRAVIYENQLAGIIDPALPSDVLGAPRYTMTAFRDKLFARMGSPLTSYPKDTTITVQEGYLVCLDLTAEGRLLWKAEPEAGYSFEGSPVADANGVYVAMRRRDIRPRALVACLEPETGRLRWRRFVCGAETPAHGMLCECTHNLLTLGEGVLYYNTNLGAVAAIRVEDGRTLWVSLYPRERRGDLTKLAPHWRRDLNPCVLHDGTLLAAPADTPRIFCLDAATGQMLWQTGTEVEDAVDLLGVTDRWLIAGGGKLYWIGLHDDERGRVKRVWPEGPERPGYGRGVLAGQDVLWPTREKLYIFDRDTAEPRKVVDLAIRGASGGNLLVADGRLLVATEKEVIAIGTDGKK